MLGDPKVSSAIRNWTMFSPFDENGCAELIVIIQVHIAHFLTTANYNAFERTILLIKTIATLVNAPSWLWFFAPIAPRGAWKRDRLETQPHLQAFNTCYRSIGAPIKLPYSVHDPS